MFLLLVLLVPGTAAAERVADVIQHQRQHGYASPAEAIARLDAAEDVPGPRAALPQRQAYAVAIATLAVEAGNADRSRRAFEDLEAMADREGCTACRAAAIIGRAHQALDARDADAAEALLDRADPLMPASDRHTRLALHIARARLRNLKGQFGQGIAEAVAAMRLADELDSPADRLRAMVPLIGMNADLGDLTRAEALGEEARRTAAAIGSDYQHALVRLQQGYVYALAGKADQQLVALHDALKIAGDDPGQAKHSAIALANIADYHLQRGESRQAMQFARRAEALATQHADDNSRSVALANMGLAAAQLGDSPAAITHMEDAIRVAEKIGATAYVIAMTEELATLYERAGRKDDALDAMRQVVRLNRDMSKRERERSVLELQEKYAADAREREIERLQAAGRLRASEQQARVWQQRLWVAVSVALALAASLLVLLLKRLRRDARRLAVDNEALVLESSRDPLTGAFNRRHAHALLARLHEQPGAGVGLMLLDVDLFKQINDTHGHAAGDAVLMAIASRLQALVRDRDAVVRWGGEEFVLVLPDTSAEGVVSLSGRVLDAIGAQPIRVDGIDVPVTVSIGNVHSPLWPDASWADALHIADLALYLSKSGGRNRATTVMTVAEGADTGRLRRDLAAAREAGEVSLAVVEGPPQARGATARRTEDAR